MLAFRKPIWAFAALGLALNFAIGFALVTWVVPGFRFHGETAAVLVWPCAIGAGLAAGLLWGRVRRAAISAHWQVARTSALAWAASGLAWPLSFGISAVLGGDAQELIASLMPALIGALVGAISGAAGGCVAAFAALHKR
ncbi:MAG: hypothetical protein AB7L65_02485 [Hyphomonadaceae bacterium]